MKDTFTKGLSYVFNSKSNDIDFLIAELIRTRLITPMLVYKINLLWQMQSHGTKTFLQKAF